MAPKGFQQLTKKVTPKIKGGRKYRSTYIKKKRHGFFRHQSDTAIRVKVNINFIFSNLINIILTI